MSTASIITDLQKINPSAVIELFELTTDATLHGSTQTYRFHNGTSLNANGDIVWAGNQYLKMPIQAEGKALGLALSSAIQSELIKQQRPGGLLS